MVPGAVISTLASGYLAYALPEQRVLFATAAGLVLCPPIFTRVVMNEGIKRLLEISRNAVEQQKAEQSGEVAKLLKAWVVQNWVRAGLSFGAGLVAFLAIHRTMETEAGKLKA